MECEEETGCKEVDERSEGAKGDEKKGLSDEPLTEENRIYRHIVEKTITNVIHSPGVLVQKTLEDFTEKDSSKNKDNNSKGRNNTTGRGRSGRG